MTSNNPQYYNPQYNAINQADYPDVNPVPVSNNQGGHAPVQQSSLINNQNQSPPPQNASYAQPSGDYDPYNVNYHPITVEQWQNVPSEKTDYSQYWESPDSFKPDKFSNNSKTETKCNDIAFAIIFILVFLLTIAMFIYTWLKVPAEDKSFTPDKNQMSSVTRKLVWKCIGISLAIAVVFNIVHDIFLYCAPVVYIKAGLWIGLIVSVLAIIAPLYYGYYAAVVFPIIMLLFSICFFCMARKYIKISASIMKQTSRILLKFPTIFLLILLECIIQAGLTIFFSFFIYAVQMSGINKCMYILIVVSYLWTNLTSGYVIYLAISGVAASWYFLYGTEYMPDHPVLQSLKRASTTSFGSACIAALLLAFVELLEFLVQSANSGNCILSILKCFAMCILSCLKCCIEYLNRYALIYCATFGVPFKEGCRRFIELRCNRFADLIMNSCIISNVTYYNMLVFSIGACLTGFGIGYGIYHNKSKYAQSFICAYSFAFAFALFFILRQPFVVISDTLLLCFVENPECLKTSANELYETMKHYYGDKLEEKLHKN